MSAHELIGTIAAIWTVFFVIAPGGATQYLIWLVAPYALYRLRLAVVYVVAATPFLYFFYRNAAQVSLTAPPISGPPAAAISATAFDWSWFGIFLWFVLAIILVTNLPRWWRPANSSVEQPLVPNEPGLGIE